MHLIKRMVEVYDWLVLSAIIDAILLKTTDAVGPMPPIVLQPFSPARMQLSLVNLIISM